MDEKIVSPTEYAAKRQMETVVKLTSGYAFKIKKLTMRDFTENGIDSYLDSARTLMSETEERRNALVQKMTLKEKAENIRHQDMIVCLGCVEPKISTDKQDGSLHVKELSDVDYYELIANIMQFARGGLPLQKPGREVEEVSKNKQSDNSGQDSEKVQTASV